MNKTLRTFVLATIALMGFGYAQAADHRDSPRMTAAIGELGNLDILDVYAFQSPQTPKNTVLVMTASTDAGVITPTFFNAYGLYEFKVTNLLNFGNYSAPLTFQLQFSLPDNKLQQFVVLNKVTDGGVQRLAVGKTNTNIALANGGKLRCGLFDDPFFFDLLAFNKFKAAAFANDPTRANIFLKRNGGAQANIPNNFFGGFNCIAIVLEVPSSALLAGPNNTKIGVWARTVIPGTNFFVENPDQFDRKGRPAINTVLMPDALKDDFNSASPLTDIRYRAAAKEELRILFGTPDAMRESQVNLLLPDVLTFDTTSKEGFDKLNGRRLSDDVVDVELSLLTGGAVTTDSVPNDSVFSNKFPYLGSPNPKP